MPDQPTVSPRLAKAKLGEWQYHEALRAASDSHIEELADELRREVPAPQFGTVLARETLAAIGMLMVRRERR